MLSNKEGQKVPDVTFKIRDNGDWKELSTSSIFKGKKVVLFALPGAFTPTCSSTHLPRYNKLTPVFKSSGIDEVICLSVNDTFAMNAWKNEQQANNVRFIPDGNGEFSEKMGMLVDKSAIGFSKRSWRYSMYVEDGIIKKMFIEPEKDGDPFEVSDADTMIDYLGLKEMVPPSVSIISRPGCPFCEKAKRLLTQSKLDFEEISLSREFSSMGVEAITGKGTVPQVFIGGKHIGGSEELEEYLKLK